METPGDAYFVIANYVFDVDFRVLRDSLRRAGGRVFLSGPDSHLVVAAVRFSPADGVAPESPQYSANRVRSHNIRRAFRERLVREGPQKFFQFKRRFEERRPVLDARGLHEWLRAACGDPVALNLAYSDALLEDLTRLTAQSSSNAGANELRMALYETLLSVEALFYPLGGAGEEDTFFYLGNLFGALGYYADALRCFTASAATYGADTHTSANLELCRSRLL